MCDDRSYALGSKFLGLPARASRDGDEGSNPVVGTSVHMELYAARAEHCRPPYLAIAFEPSTALVISCRAVSARTAAEAYDATLWHFIEAYLDGVERTHRPATLTFSDVGLADYIFGVIQGCGTDVACISPSQPVQWPAEGTPMVGEALATALTGLRASGIIREALSSAAEADAALVPVGACHDGQCGAMVERAALKRCSACKATRYCSAACQQRHWPEHRAGCRELVAKQKRAAAAPATAATKVLGSDSKAEEKDRDVT
jgi:hypothetical protein